MAPGALGRRALLGLLLSGGARAAEPTCGPLRLALLPAPGVFEWSSDGQHRGLELAVAHALEQRSGCSLQLRPTNAARLWGDVLQGQVDLSSGAALLPGRAEQADFILLAALHPVLLMRRELAERLPQRADFEAQAPLRLGVVRMAKRAAAVQAWVDKLRAQGRVVESLDDATSLRVFEAGRCDAVLVFATVLQSRPDAWWRDHQVVDWFPGTEFQVGWVASHHLSAAQRLRLRQAAEGLRQDGTLERLVRQHLGEAAAPYLRYLPLP
ncbi:MAG: transporter substrate-binding domain-containing protein [Inhella sp.]